MARYPALPKFLKNVDLVYEEIQRWGSVLVRELDSRDLEDTNKPSTNIYVVVTATNIKRPRKGDIVYSASSGKFKGYVSLGAETSWQDLN